MTTQYDIFNHLFQTKLNSWTPLRGALCHLFDEREIAHLDRSNRMFQPDKRVIVQLSFENGIAAHGGLAAVIRHFPPIVQKQGENIILLTPFHCGCGAVNKAVKNGRLVKKISGVKVRVCSFSGEVVCYEERGAEVPTWHIGIKNHFNAGDNPYGYNNDEDLLFDSLAFTAAVPAVLERLGYTDNLIVHAHDWETAPIALFARCAVLSGLLQQVKTVMTLHNSFDAPFPDRLKKYFFGKTFDGDTVLQCMLPLLQGPLSTVSTPFAHELRNDPLQCGFFVDHLQKLFRMNPPLGVENGMFGKPDIPFTNREITAAGDGDFSLLLGKKESWRSTFLSAVQKGRDSNIIGSIANEVIDDPSIPVFFMSGRLDLMQKGFDTVFHAFKKLKPGSAFLFFCPTLNNGDDDLSFFSEIAKQCRGYIVIWPFRISNRMYQVFIQGASYLLMPSFYEPFGAASEGMLHGTPVIARATGGLLAQIQPGETFFIPDLYSSLFPDKITGRKNGILFKEEFPDSEAKKIWRTLLHLPLQKRIDNPLYRSIVDAAFHALTEAVSNYSDRTIYASMVFRGIQSVQQFSWEIAVRKYRTIYTVAANRGY